MTDKANEILKWVVKTADDKLAEDIVALNMKDLSLLADYFVIMHGNSDRQVLAISDGIIKAAAENETTINRIEGRDSAKWILIDLGDVIVHIFDEEQRDLYSLEKLWEDAELVDVQEYI
ncbi:ribosome silencing factor [Lacticigenium naphthae]|uniref:ribosome silencing factor n=1 Tax=Lacticigenium naphthae TaxID=515351 RepID=UPI0004273427|nr:ribosome silencing factor [Lacticigenium naphthae]